MVGVKPSQQVLMLCGRDLHTDQQKKKVLTDEGKRQRGNEKRKLAHSLTRMTVIRQEMMMACLKMRQRREVMKKKKSNDSGAMSVCKWFLEWETYNSYSWCLS